MVKAYFVFYDNIQNKNSQVPVEFSSEKKGDEFIDKYQNFGGFRRFNYDYYGKTSKKGFVDWLKKEYPEVPINLIKQSIVNFEGKKLFNHLMFIFEDYSRNLRDRKSVV